MNGRNMRRCLACCLLLLATAGCSTRSISDSGYTPGSDNRLYRGELSEFDVIGIDRGEAITQKDIEAAFTDKQRLSLRKGTTLMLIQSGAMFPDTEMLKPLEQYYNVAQFSGIPERSESTDAVSASYALALRLAAARGNIDTIIVYWGILETAREGLPTKALSWVPIVGGVLPDENQRMRIRLKAAVIDVRTGRWEEFSPAPIDDNSLSGSYTRAASDQDQVALLKSKAYQQAAMQIVDRYAE
ncbi:MAG TPA: aminopeptidase [Methylomirabilota bacterium]|nr:aminopeptidase [Methylomirabilota bacterium]